MIFFPFSLFAKVYLSRPIFGFICCLFCIYLALLVSISPLSFLIIPSHFPLFFSSSFILFRKWHRLIYIQGGGGYFPIYTPMLISPYSILFLDGMIISVNCEVFILFHHDKIVGSIAHSVFMFQFPFRSPFYLLSLSLVLFLIIPLSMCMFPLLFQFFGFSLMSCRPFWVLPLASLSVLICLLSCVCQKFWQTCWHRYQ